MNYLQKLSNFTLLGTNQIFPQQPRDLTQRESGEKHEDGNCNGPVPKKRRQKQKDGVILVCQVCGDRSSGYNFNAVTCEACKAFFRRNALKTEVPTCNFNGKCPLDHRSRKLCAGCRLRKCFDIGMKKEWILGKEQLQKRRKRTSGTSTVKVFTLQGRQIAFQRQMVTHYVRPNDIVQSGRKFSAEGASSANIVSRAVNESCSGGSVGDLKQPVKTERKKEILNPLTLKLQGELCNLETVYKTTFDSGFSEDERKKVVENPENANDLFITSERFIHNLVKFVKYLQEFKSLEKIDKIVIIKEGIMDMVTFRSAMLFNPVNHNWEVFRRRDNQRMFINASVIRKILGSATYEEHFLFADSLKQIIKGDNTITTLMFLMIVFSPDRPHLKNRAEVVKAQDKFSYWLQLYLQSIVPMKEAESLYNKLLMKMLEIKGISEQFAEMKSMLDVTKVDPLVAEVFSLHK